MRKPSTPLDTHIGRIAHQEKHEIDDPKETNNTLDFKKEQLVVLPYHSS